MSYTVSALLLRNLHDVFGEIDPVRRRVAIDEIFHEDAVFYELIPTSDISRSLRLRRWAMVVASVGFPAALASRRLTPEPIS